MIDDRFLQTAAETAMWLGKVRHAGFAAHHPLCSMDLLRRVACRSQGGKSAA